MKPVKLTKETYRRISDQKICIVCSNLSYIEEFCGAYPVSKQITYIIENTFGKDIKCSIDSMDICVLRFDGLAQIDWNSTVIVLADDYYMELYQELADSTELNLESVRVYYFANTVMEYEERYLTKFADRPLENQIVFRSGPHASSYVKGMDFADNARALFEYMLKNGYCRKYRLVWIVKNPEEYQAYRRFDNVEFVAFDDAVSDDPVKRDRYYEILFLAKYIFFTDAYGFAKSCRKGQIRVQLWHGCGFKTRVNFSRCERRYEYNIVISEKYKEIHACIYGLREDQVLVTGYPKEDWLFERHREYFKELGIPEAGKYIFWLPTFRSTDERFTELNQYQLEGSTGLPIVENLEQAMVLNRLLAEQNIVLIVKLHPFQDEKAITDQLKASHIVTISNQELARKDIQINQLLGMADAMISDYSSAAIDYLILDRPMAFTLTDVEEYQSSRGFVFDKIEEWLPGARIYDMKNFLEFVTEVGNGVDSTQKLRNRIRKALHAFSDGNGCKRVLEALNIEL